MRKVLEERGEIGGLVREQAALGENGEEHVLAAPRGISVSRGRRTVDELSIRALFPR
jgi:hypothetical protein